MTTAAGVADTGNTWAPVWGDYDNDGFLDLFVTKAGRTVLGPGNANLLYHNNGDGRFTNRAAEEGLELQDDYSLHKGAAWADYNNDGFLDLLVKDGIGSVQDNGEAANGLHRLFKNSGNSNHFIKVNLKGLQSNRSGIGARVTVTYTGGMAYRQNNGGGGGGVRFAESRAAAFRHRNGDGGNSRGKVAKRGCRYSVFSCSQFDYQGGGRFRSVATLREFRQLRRMVCCRGSHQPQGSPIALRILAE